ncbi:U4/U6.U5 tri-snRNP-associated protein 2, partial [Operophtera brumata]
LTESSSSDSSLNDIKYVLNPIFDEEQIAQMDSNTKMSRAADGSMYMPGIVGLNNIKANDYCNVILQVDLKSDEYSEMITESPFLYLTCDLPPTPLFTDEFRENIIPQVNLYQLLSKFNGQSSKEYKTYKENFLKRFEITQLPPYLILYIKRFTKNTFFVEKNPTVVNFPVNEGEAQGEDDVRAGGEHSARRHTREGHLPGSCAAQTYTTVVRILTPEVKAKHKGKTTYELVGNIVHDGTPEKGTYRAHVLHKPTQQWYEMQDLHVTSVLSQMITLTEAYIQIYELKQD